VELSIGDVVLSGGEPAALVVADAVTRLLPGAVGNAQSVEGESFVSARLEHPHFTRPPLAGGRAVPPVLLSGDHARIAAWRQAVSVVRTERRRPDLLMSVPAEKAERKALSRHGSDIEEWLVERRDWQRWWAGRAAPEGAEPTVAGSAPVDDDGSGGKIG
jgi:tRNA (guanine37-N1)-methyltransferase